MRLRTPLAVLGSAALALGILSAGTTPAATGTAGPAAAAAEPVLDTYLRDTWKSFSMEPRPATSEGNAKSCTRRPVARSNPRRRGVPAPCDP